MTNAAHRYAMLSVLRCAGATIGFLMSAFLILWAVVTVLAMIWPGLFYW
jgi:hypothetical protein